MERGKTFNKKNKTSKTKKKLLTIKVLFLLIITSIISYSVFSNFKPFVWAINLIKNQENFSLITPVSTNKINPSIIWNSQPKEMDFPDLFNNEYKQIVSNSNIQKTAIAKEIGANDDGDKVIYLKFAVEEGGEASIFIVKKTDGRFLYLNNNDQKYNPAYFLDLNKIAESEEGEEILNIPESLKHNNLSLKKKNISNLNIVNDLVISTKKVKDTEYGEIFVRYQKNNENSGISKTFFLINKIGITIPYLYDFNLSNNENKIVVNFEKFNIKTSDFFSNGFDDGCCAQNNSVILPDSPLANSIEKIGYLESGSPIDKNIYHINNTENKIVRELYEKYIEIYNEISNYDSSKQKPKLSIEEFNNTNSYFLWKDNDGDWQLFINNYYYPVLQCFSGKPVIYLYPLKETNVKVSVGADITESEPLYPEKGWNVLARPSGEIIYQNKSYPYLFWEGYGKGGYPSVKNKGFIVEQKSLISTIRSHLKKQGLNNQESNDFIDFWKDHLPKSEYVKLTWLTTAEMNIMAPLDVSPKPDTVIRVYLDATVADKNDKLINQSLKSIPRKGFTLIEWGGRLAE